MGAWAVLARWGASGVAGAVAALVAAMAVLCSCDSQRGASGVTLVEKRVGELGQCRVLVHGVFHNPDLGLRFVVVGWQCPGDEQIELKKALAASLRVGDCIDAGGQVHCVEWLSPEEGAVRFVHRYRRVGDVLEMHEATRSEAIE